MAFVKAGVQPKVLAFLPFLVGVVGFVDRGPAEGAAGSYRAAANGVSIDDQQARWMVGGRAVDNDPSASAGAVVMMVVGSKVELHFLGLLSK